MDSYGYADYKGTQSSYYQRSLLNRAFRRDNGLTRAELSAKQVGRHEALMSYCSSLHN